jgi:Leucine-rich repeat (LRR) protein
LQVLDLAFNALTGPIPDELVALTHLVSISLDKNELTGPVPPWIGKLENLSSLALSVNQLSGSIPPEIGNCLNLKALQLDDNRLSGSIPPEICNAVNLGVITLSRNMLTGNISDTFRRCTNLTQIDLTSNRLSGPLPSYLHELPGLVMFAVGANQFSETIPDSLWSSETLLELQLENNKLRGGLSPLIGRSSSLQYLVLDNNQFEGSIPEEIGNLTNLSFFSAQGNNFSGTIPVGLCNCLQLTTLDLGNNSLTGTIPSQIGALVNLDHLGLSHNRLTGQIPSEICTNFQVVSSFLQHHGTLDLSWNDLSGQIPPRLGDCTVLVDLILSGNHFTGPLPRELAKLSNLTSLDVSFNKLSGTIPTEFGESRKLQGLNFAYNMLTGPIPLAFGNISSLVKLNLTGNRLTGSLPPRIGNLTNLSYLDVSNNRLSGEIPNSMANMISMVGLDLGDNLFSGTIGGLLSESAMWHQFQSLNLENNLFSGGIPSSVGNFTELSFLDLSNNRFSGKFPNEFGNLRKLVHIDLSNNDLHGDFPASLCGFKSLAFLNISNNEISGRIPNTGKCQTLAPSSVLGNVRLCGEVLNVWCPPTSEGAGRNMSRGAIVGVVVGCSIVVLGFACFTLRCWLTRRRDGVPKDAEKIKLNMVSDTDTCTTMSKSKEPLSINIAMFERPLMARLTLADILQATNNFCKTNIIGDGGFGTVYKAVLSDGRVVAIKKLGASTTQGDREFLAEMETLGKVKHQNLVPLLGYCSFAEEKLLVYDYMANGSLDLWLRNRADAVEVLDWSKRFKIAMGSARGIAFLHHGFIPHIIHRDIKASNILLDEDFEPRVADFGLARLISAYETHVSTDIAGTFGYIPPEYGHCWRATTRGDVYSYGVILLELLTGKEPTGKEFDNIQGGNLVGCVRQMIKQGNGPEALDPIIANGPWKNAMLTVLHIANMCTAEEPARRPTMQQVVQMLKDVEARSTLISTSSNL